MEALRVERLSKDFGGIHAVKNVSFAVGAGDLLAFIGPNGAGKTTLLNLINGQYKAASGSIKFFGQDITNLPTYERAALGQARSFQITCIFKGLSVIDNALIAVQGTKSSQYQPFKPISAYRSLHDKAHEILESMELWNLKDELVRNLSYGEQRRLEVCMSLASEPRMVLLDEPSCGLSPKECDGMMNLIRRLGENLTVIIVAHDMDLVFGVAKRIIVLHYGQIIADGTCLDIQKNQQVQEIYMGIDEEGN